MKNIIRGCYAIFFYKASLIQITPYGVAWSVAFAGQKTDHYLTIHPKLEEKWFRSLFTCFELILFKICHIYFENMDPEYTIEKAKTSARLKKIVELIDDIDKSNIMKLFRDVWYVRNVFSHTFIDLKEIEFCKIPLDACFGTTYAGSVHNEVDFTFVENADRLISPFIEFFKKRQIEQIDKEKFASICNVFLTERTLGR